MGKLFNASTSGSQSTVTATDMMLEIWCGNIIAGADHWITRPDTKEKAIQYSVEKEDHKTRTDEIYMKTYTSQYPSWLEFPEGFWSVYTLQISRFSSARLNKEARHQ